MKFDTFFDIMTFARAKEKEAALFYLHCRNEAKRPELKKIFLELAEEEERHMLLLDQFTDEPPETVEPVTDLKIGDYLIDMTFHPDMTYRELLVLAIKREEKAYQFYRDVTKTESGKAHRTLFQKLANEELKHKRRLEDEYDDSMWQN